MRRIVLENKEQNKNKKKSDYFVGSVLKILATE
jgi:hypothetical protein